MVLSDLCLLVSCVLYSPLPECRLDPVTCFKQIEYSKGDEMCLPRLDFRKDYDFPLWCSLAFTSSLRGKPLPCCAMPYGETPRQGTDVSGQ